MEAQLLKIRDSYRDATATATISKANYGLLLDAFEIQWKALSPAPQSDLDYRRNLVGGGRGFGEPPGSMSDRIGHARAHVNEATSLPATAGHAIADNLLALFRTTSPTTRAVMHPVVQQVHAAVIAGAL